MSACFYTLHLISALSLLSVCSQSRFLYCQYCFQLSYFRPKFDIATDAETLKSLDPNSSIQAANILQKFLDILAHAEGTPL